jgi:hypothetical protein
VPEQEHHYGQWEKTLAEVQQRIEVVKEQLKQLEEQRRQLEELRKQEENAHASENERELAKQRHEKLTQALAVTSAGIGLLTAGTNLASATAAEPQAAEPSMAPEQGLEIVLGESQSVKNPSTSVEPDSITVTYRETFVTTKEGNSSATKRTKSPGELAIESGLKVATMASHTARPGRHPVPPQLKQDIASLMAKHPDSMLKHQIEQLLGLY